mmetsp:Transcript_20734/g.29800  ORF Transcript_20734/g.29800 Transcript_20734/m.29800 type:complete len:215 (-) Transcript_20734:1187-1831(-)
MMSLCFRRSCLYRSTWAFSSTIVSRSLSRSASFPSYSCRSLSCCSFISTCISGCASSPPGVPGPSPRSPRIIWPISIAIRCSRRFFSSFSCINSFDLISNALIAAILSASALRRCSSSSKSRLLSTTFLDLASSSALSFLSSRSYFRRSDFWSRSSLTFASFLIFLALLANLRVDKVSAMASSAGDIIAIIVVLQFPPNESSSTRVSLLSRYGM